MQELPQSEGTTLFSADVAQGARPFRHTWEHTVGSGHATLALRADWQRQLERAHRELGFRYVRFHGLLSDDMGTLTCQSDRLIDSFFNADQVFDFLLSIGMRPFVELSFMPSTLSSGDKTVFHYRANVTPPRDYGAWSALIERLARHWVERYGIAEVRQWFFEVWNEPNLDAFWTAGQAAYFELYKCSALALKSVSPDLKVGGPATSHNTWLPEFLAFAALQNLPVDFVSTHHYPTDDFGQPGDDTVAQLAASRRSILRDQVRTAKGQVGEKPLYYTEWSTSSNPFDELHDRPYAAAFIVKSVLEACEHVEAYSYWTFSDIFEENYFSSAPFHGGFGLTTIYGVPKPAYRAFELMHRLGDQILATSGSHPTVDVWITRTARQVQVLLSNSALPRHPISDEAVTVRLDGIQSIRSVVVERIDDRHANARGVWELMGAPASLSPALVQALEGASALVPAALPHRLGGGSLTLDLLVPVQGVALVTIELA